MREIIRGLAVALVAIALLIGCLLLIVGVGLWRIRSDGVREPAQAQRAPIAAAAPDESAGHTPAGIAPLEPGPRVAPSVEAATRPDAQSPHRAPPAGVASERTKSPPMAPAAPAMPAAEHARASLLRVDDDSAGGWIGRYGKKGYVVAAAGEPKSLPPGVSMSMERAHLYIWSPVTTDRRGLSLPADPPRLSAGQWFSWDQFSVDLDLRGTGQEAQVALYLVDWDSDARAQRLEVTDAATGAMLLSRSDEHFKKGRYLLLKLSGHVKLTFTKSAGANATVSGVFFDDLPALAR